MKIISGLFGVLMLTLLPSPSHAQADYTKVKQDLFASAKNLKSLDAVMGIQPKPLDTYFKNGNLRLDRDEVFLIRGGHGTISEELDQYVHRVIMNSFDQLTDRVTAYGCYVKPTLGKAKAYVMVFGDSAKFAPNINQWGGNNGWCTGTWALLIPGDSSVKVSDLSRRVATIYKN
jgi:hypothetical protein